MKKCFLKIFSLLISICFIFQSNMVFAISITDPLTDDEVTITNNAGSSDTIYVTGVMPGDIIKVYNAASGGKIIGKGTVGSNKTDLKISIAQLGISSGSVYISDASKGMSESKRIRFDFDAEPVSDAPLISNITITNNSGKSDMIYISGLVPGDLVKIYNKEAGGSLVETATVSNNTTEVTKSFNQLGVNGGSLYFSVTSKGMRESSRVKASFSPENYSSAPKAGNIKVTNNSGKNDTIYVSGLAPSDIVKIYTELAGGNLIGTATVGSNSTDVTKSFAQLGANGGNLYISVTSKGMHESDRTCIAFPAENKSASIPAKNVIITNNTGKADTIYVNGLSAQDKVSVYTAAYGGMPIATGIVAASCRDLTISIPQLGKDSGTAYISIISADMGESDRIGVAYSSETRSNSIDQSSIIVTNNAGAADTVCVSNLTAGDIINVYDALTGGDLLGSATAAAGSTNATVSITQFGSDSGTVYITVTSANKLESNRVPVSYSAEGQSKIIDQNNIIVSNNTGKNDTVYVSGLNAGDVVNVYDALTGGNLLGSATVAAGSVDATVSVAQLGTDSGNVYVSVTSINKIKSPRTQAVYSAEGKSSTLDASNIVVINNAGQPDTVQVDGLSNGDAVNVYDAVKGGNLLGTATVSQYDSKVTVTIAQLGSHAENIYVSVKSPNKIESDRIVVSYSAESQTALVDASNVSITNNSGTSDAIKVSGLSANDVVKVYDLAKGGNLLGTGTVVAGGTSVNIPITQLGTESGSVYISVTTASKTESDRIKADYLAEPVSNAPAASSIVVTNNAGIADTVEVTGLSADDIVNAYDSAIGGILLGTATVESYKTSAIVSVNQLGTGSGNIYISVTSASKLESARTQVGFIAESKSNAPRASDVIIVNNAGIDSTITVKGINSGDIINIYNSAAGGTLLGTATVGKYDTDITIPVTQLGSAAGSVYISSKSTGKLESNRTEVNYSAKLVTSAPDAENINIVNNATIPGTISVMGLQPNDVVNVYDSAQNGTLLVSAAVPSGSKKVTITLTQLNINGGTVYVSAKSAGKAESNRTAAAYYAVSKSYAPSSGDITIANNSGIPDSIKVTGLSPNDIVNVYRMDTSRTLLGTATVASDSSYATVSISQLGTDAGSIYISAIRYGDTESDMVKADYVSESTSPILGNISIVNNAILPDTVTVNGLEANDIVNVYDAAVNGNLLGSAVVAANNTSVVVTIPQLTTAAGSIYISVANFGKAESNRTKASYIAEQNSTALFAGNISILNNKVGTSDIIKAGNLEPNSLVKVYDAPAGGNLIGIATASSNGSQVTITIPQLSVGAGSVYLSVTTPGKNESSRTEADYTAEN